MSCDHLICAYCAGPVEEGRCPSCRAARSRLHRSQGPLTPRQLAIIAALVLILAFGLAAPHLT